MASCLWQTLNCCILLDELLFCRPCVGSDRHSSAVIANGRVQSMVNPWETCGWHSGTVTVLSASVPLSVSFDQWSVLIFIILLLLQKRTSGRTYEPSNKWGGSGETRSSTLFLAFLCCFLISLFSCLPVILPALSRRIMEAHQTTQELMVNLWQTDRQTHRQTTRTVRLCSLWQTQVAGWPPLALSACSPGN